MAETPHSEVLTQEAKITFETACGLQRREDAVLSGTDLRIGFLMKDEYGNDFSDDQKKAKAGELANKLNSLKENNKPILGKNITDQEILSLSTKIEELLKSDKFAGVFVNILGEAGKGGEMSALAMVVFLDYINSHFQEPPEQLLKGAYEQVSKVLKAAGGGKISFAAALVDKKGELTAVNPEGQKILIFGQKQSRTETITEGKENDGTPQIQKTQLQDGDKIILCPKEMAVDKIDRAKEVKKIVESLTLEKDAQAVSGGERKDNSDRIQANQTHRDQPQLITLRERIIIVDRDEKEGGRKVSARDYIKTEEYKQRRRIVDRMLKPDGKNYDPEVLRIFPRRQDESDKEYEYRLFKQLEEELRNLGDSRDLAKDNLYHFFYRPKGESGPIFNLRQTDLLTIAEATRRVLAYDLNYQKANQERRDLLEAKRQQMRTVERTNEILYTIVPRGSAVSAEGDYRKIRESGRFTPEAETDISAFRLLVDYLGDQNVSRILPLLEMEGETAEAQKYNETLRSLVDKARGQDGKIKYEDLLKVIREAKRQEKDDNKRFVFRLIDANLRHLFYHSIEQALQLRESRNLESINPFVKDIIQRLNQISLNKERINQLINDIPHAVWRERIRKSLIEGGNYDVLFSAALKGAEYLRRMAKEPVKLPQPEEVDLMMIIDKDEYQGLTLKDIAEPDESESGSATGGTPRREPPNGSGGSPRSLEPPDIPAAPTPENNRGGNGKGNGEGKNGKLPPAPGIRTEPGGPSGPSPTPQPEPQPPPTELNIAFASVDIGAENAADVSRHITSQNEEIFRNKLFRIGKIRLDPVDLVADGLAYLSGKLAFKGQVKRGAGVIPALLANVPSMALGGLSGLLKGVRHPGHYFWQGMLFKPAFDRQRQQFASEMVGTIRQELVASSQTGVGKDVVASLPVKVSADLVDLAFKRGSEIRNRNIGSRIGNWLKDQTYNIRGLFGGKSSEQSLAYKWLQEQIRAYKGGKPVDPEFLKQWQKLEQSYLEEQEAHGAKFTVEGALEETAGETRFDLKVENELLASAAEKKLKEIIAKYAPQLKTATDERAKRELKKQLALEVNQYLRSDEFYGQLTTQQREAFSAKEIASNVTAIAEQVAQRWDENGYLKPKGEDGKTLWDETHLNIFLARGAGGGVRGRTEYGGIEGIGQWREKLERRIAERSIGICSPGMSQAAERMGRFWDLLSRIGIPTKEIALYTSAGVIGYYGTAIIEGLANRKLMAGAGVAGAMAFVAATGGTGIVPVIGAAAGVGLVAAIKERSRLAQERYQMSREVALGRQSSPFALLRQEMIRGLVPPRKADELITSIKGFLEGDLSDPDKVKNFALLLTEITARLNITNLSQREGALQHLIQYEEGRDMRQNSELVTLLAQGRVDLWKAIKGNDQLKNLVLLGQKADNEREFLQAFDRVVSLTEAQLRFGSEGKALKRIEDWLKREKTRFGFNTDQEVKTFVQKILPDWDLKIGHEQTIDQANRNFGVLQARRMGQVFLTSVMTSGISWGLGELGITRPVSEIRDGIKAELDEYKQEGFNQWFQDWKNVVVNDRFDLEINGAGKLVADLTPFQRGVLQARNFFEPPPFQPIHTQIIDGIKVTLPGFYQWQEVNIGGKNYDGLVDLRTGDVIDMSHYRIDTPEGLEQFKTDLEATGAQVNIIVDKIVGNPVIQHKDLLVPQGQTEIINPVTGKMMFAPKGDNWHSEWRQDGDKYDLVAIDNSTNQPIVDHLGQQKILIDDAQLTKDGQILGGTYDHNLIRIDQQRIETELGSQKIVVGERAVEGWKELVRPIEKEIWWTNRTRGSDLQELRLYNQVYQNPDGTYAVILDGNHMGQTINPFSGQIEHVSDIISDSTRAPYGMQFNVTIPGVGHFIFDAQEGNIADLNPLSNDIVKYCGQPIIFQGHQLTFGELAKMFLGQENIRNHVQEAGLNVSGKPVSLASEYRGWLDIFNVGNGGQKGIISVGYTDPEGRFHYLASIRGSGEINYLETSTSESRWIPVIEMINKITDRIEQPAETAEVTTITIEGKPLEPPPKVYWPLPYTVRETLEKSHPPSKPQDQQVRPPTTGVPTDTTFPASLLPTDLSQKPVGIDREALTEDLKSEYDQKIMPVIRELIEALKSDDDEKIKQAKKKLIDNLKQLDEKAKGKPGYQKPAKDPDRSVEDLEKWILAEIGQDGKQFEGKTEQELRLLLDERKRQLEALEEGLKTISGGNPSLEKKRRQLIKEIAEIESRLKKIGQSSSADSSTGQVQSSQDTSGEAEARLEGGKSQEDTEMAKKIQETEKELATTLDQFFQKASKEEIKGFIKSKFGREIDDNEADKIKNESKTRRVIINQIIFNVIQKNVNDHYNSLKDNERQNLRTRSMSEAQRDDPSGFKVYQRVSSYNQIFEYHVREKITEFKKRNNNQEPNDQQKKEIIESAKQEAAKSLGISIPTDDEIKKAGEFIERWNQIMISEILDEPAVKRTLLSTYETIIKEINKSLKKLTETSNNRSQNGNKNLSGESETPLGKTFQIGDFIRYQNQTNWQIIGYDSGTGQVFIKNTTNPTSNPIAVDLKDILRGKDNKLVFNPFEGMTTFQDWKKLENFINQLGGMFDNTGNYISAHELIKLINEIKNGRKESHEIDNLPILKSVIENMISSDKQTFLNRAEMKIRRSLNLRTKN